MTWIRSIGQSEASGRLAKTYKAAVARAGRVFGILRCMSLSPEILDSSMGLYQRVMHARVGLARYQRELIATVVSRANDCHY
ncbi:MAG: alkylhydroperoxidase family enzyme [Planctomycetota bacterium]|jgi:alkylhydroperoxidase family enzyme